MARNGYQESSELQRYIDRVDSDIDTRHSHESISAIVEYARSTLAQQLSRCKKNVVMQESEVEHHKQELDSDKRELLEVTNS